MLHLAFTCSAILFIDKCMQIIYFNWEQINNTIYDIKSFYNFLYYSGDKY